MWPCTPFVHTVPLGMMHARPPGHAAIGHPMTGHHDTDLWATTILIYGPVSTWNNGSGCVHLEQCESVHAGISIKN